MNSVPGRQETNLDHSTESHRTEGLAIGLYPRLLQTDLTQMIENEEMIDTHAGKLGLGGL